MAAPMLPAVGAGEDRFGGKVLCPTRRVVVTYECTKTNREQRRRYRQGRRVKAELPAQEGVEEVEGRRAASKRLSRKSGARGELAARRAMNTRRSRISLNVATKKKKKKSYPTPKKTRTSGTGDNTIESAMAASRKVFEPRRDRERRPNKGTISRQGVGAVALGANVQTARIQVPAHDVGQ